MDTIDWMPPHAAGDHTSRDVSSRHSGHYRDEDGRLHGSGSVFYPRNAPEGGQGGQQWRGAAVARGGASTAENADAMSAFDGPTQPRSSMCDGTSGLLSGGGRTGAERGARAGRFATSPTQQPQFGSIARQSRSQRSVLPNSSGEHAHSGRQRFAARTASGTQGACNIRRLRRNVPR